MVRPRSSTTELSETNHQPPGTGRVRQGWGAAEIGNAHATLYVSLPLLGPDRGVVCTTGAFTRLLTVRADRTYVAGPAACGCGPGRSSPCGGGGGGHTYIWWAQPQQCWVVLVASMVYIFPSVSVWTVVDV